MLRHLTLWHEIHYVAIEDPEQPESPARAHEYSFKAYPFPCKVPDKRSPAFAPELLKGLASKVPLAVSRFDPPGMREFLDRLIRGNGLMWPS